MNAHVVAKGTSALFKLEATEVTELREGGRD